MSTVLTGGEEAEDLVGMLARVVARAKGYSEALEATRTAQVRVCHSPEATRIHIDVLWLRSIDFLLKSVLESHACGIIVAVENVRL